MKKIVFASALLILNLSAFDFNKAINSAKDIMQTSNNADYKTLVSNALNASVLELSKSGFLNNQLAKIELPAPLKMAAGLAKQVGGEKWANELTQAINQSATKAVGGASEVFLDTIKNMKESDIKELFSRKENGFTKFLQTNSSEKLSKVFKPIIADMMNQNSFARAYNGLNSYIKDGNLLNAETVSNLKGLASNLGMGEYIPNKDEDLNDYITKKDIGRLVCSYGAKRKSSS